MDFSQIIRKFMIADSTSFQKGDDAALVKFAKNIISTPEEKKIIEGYEELMSLGILLCQELAPAFLSSVNDNYRGFIVKFKEVGAKIHATGIKENVYFASEFYNAVKTIKNREGISLEILYPNRQMNIAFNGDYLLENDDFRILMEKALSNSSVSIDSPTFDIDLAKYCQTHAQSELAKNQSQAYSTINENITNHDFFKRLIDIAKNSDSNSKLASLIEEIVIIHDELENNQIPAYLYSYFIFECLDYISNNIYPELSGKFEPVRWIDSRSIDIDEKKSFNPTDEATFGVGVNPLPNSGNFLVDNSGCLNDYSGQSRIVIIPSNKNIISIGKMKKDLYSVYIPEGVKEIKEGAFSGCQSLKCIHLPKSLEKIGQKAFENCNNLTDINLENVEYIGSQSFSGCNKLNLDQQILSPSIIGYRAFSDCQSLNIMTFDNSHGNNCQFEKEIFFNCQNITLISAKNIRCLFLSSLGQLPNLKEIKLTGHSSLSYDVDYSFNKLERLFLNIEDVSILYKDLQKDISSVIEIIISKNYSEGSNNIYQRFPNVESITVLTDNVIPPYAFFKLANLKEVILLEKISSIGEYAFAGCSQLVHLNWFYSGNTLPAFAFAECSQFNPTKFLKRITSFGKCSLMKTIIDNLDFLNNPHIQTVDSGFLFGAEIENITNIDLRRKIFSPNAFSGIKRISVTIDMSQIDTFVSTYFAKKEENIKLTHFEHIKVVDNKTGIIPAYSFRYIQADALSIDGEINQIGQGAFLSSSIASLDMEYTSLYVEKEAFKLAKEAAFAIDLTKVIHIEEEAFAYNGITNINLSPDIEYIGELAFTDPSLHGNAITYKGRVANLENVSQIFVSNEESKMTFNELVLYDEELLNSNFAGVSNIKTLKLEGVVSFSSNTLAGINIENVYFGDKLKTISGTDFYVLLEEYHVKDLDISKDNPYFLVDENAILSRDKTTLYYLANISALNEYLPVVTRIDANGVGIVQQEELVIPTNVQYIGECAFNVNKVKRLIINHQVEMAKKAFYHLNNLDELSLSNIDSVGFLSIDKADGFYLSSVVVDNMKQPLSSLFLEPIELIKIYRMTIGNTLLENGYFEHLALEGLFLNNNQYNNINNKTNIKLNNLRLDYYNENSSIVVDLFTNENTNLYFDKARLLSGAFENKTYSNIKINEAEQIDEGAFKNAHINELHIENPRDIAVGAFINSHINHFSLTNNDHYFFDEKSGNLISSSGVLLRNFSSKQLSIETEKYSITHIGYGAFESANIKELVVADGVTIATKAFINTDVQSLNIPFIECVNIKSLFDSTPSIKIINYRGNTIPYGYFRSLPQLENINIEKATRVGELAFANDTLLKNIVFHEPVDYLGGMAFYKCESLASLDISNPNAYIGLGVVFGCINLSSLSFVINDSLIARKYTIYDFIGKINAPNPTIKVTANSIPDYFFTDYSNNVKVESTVYEIGNSAFKGVPFVDINTENVIIFHPYALANAVIKKLDLTAAKEIADNAFEGLRTDFLYIGEYVQNLSESFVQSFSRDAIDIHPDCQSYRIKDNCLYNLLTKTLLRYYGKEKGLITIDSDICETIAPHVFIKANNNFVIKGIKEIKPEAFIECVIDELEINSVSHIYENSFVDCHIKSLTIDEVKLGDKHSVSLYSSTLKYVNITKAIAPDNFIDDNVIEEVLIPEDVNVIPDNYLAHCKSLKKFHLPTNCSTVGVEAFKGCPIKELDLSNLLTIKERAFMDTVLESANLISSGEIGKDAFLNAPLKEMLIGKDTVGLDDELLISLEKIKIDGANPNYSLINGILYKNKEKAYLKYFGDDGNLIFDIEGATIKSTILSNVPKNVNNLTLLDINKIEKDAFDNLVVKETMEVQRCHLSKHAFANMTINKFIIDEIKVEESRRIIDLIGQSSIRSISILKDVADDVFVGPFGSDAISSTLMELQLPETLTAIPDKFCYGWKLKTVILPDKCTLIGESSFAHTDVAEINLENVETIKDGAFYRTKINALHSPKLKWIGKEVFYDDVYLESISLPFIEHIGGNAFAHTSTSNAEFGPTLKECDATILSSCRHLTRLKIPFIDGKLPLFDSTYKIFTDLQINGGEVLQKYREIKLLVPALQKVEFCQPNMVVGPEAFMNSRINNFVGFENLIKIGEKAFAGVRFHKTQTIDLSNVKEIGNNAFMDASIDAPIIINENIELLGDGVFQDANIHKDIHMPLLSPHCFYKASIAKGITLSDKIITIPEQCFYNSNINHIKIPNDCIKIDKEAFNKCRHLSQLELNDKLEYIGEYAFGNANFKNQTWELPKTVKYIGAYAFHHAKPPTIRILSSINTGKFDSKWHLVSKLLIWFPKKVTIIFH